MILVLIVAALLRGVFGHGAVTKPIPRKLASAPWCPWCVGEHNSGNPYGKVYLEANPATPCIGTNRGDARYDVGVYGDYGADFGPASYVAGQSFDAKIVLNADHGGLAQWTFCPHSETETEACFQHNTLTEWTDVHTYWGGDSSIDHWKDNSVFPQTVTLPNMNAGTITLRWLWKCKFTDEMFASCIDVDVLPSGSPMPPPAPQPPPTPEPEPTPEPPNPAPEPPTPNPTPAPNPTPVPNPTPPSPVGDECSSKFQQCGGKSWTGATCCKEGLACFTHNEWYSQCDIDETAPQDESCSEAWHQCGGTGWSGPTQCCSTHEDLQCVVENAWYSQCRPVSAGMVEAKASKKHTMTSLPESPSLMRRVSEIGPSGLVTFAEVKPVEEHRSDPTPASLPMGRKGRVVRAEVQSNGVPLL